MLWCCPALAPTDAHFRFHRIHRHTSPEFVQPKNEEKINQQTKTSAIGCRWGYRQCVICFQRKSYAESRSVSVCLSTTVYIFRLCRLCLLLLCVVVSLWSRALFVYCSTTRSRCNFGFCFDSAMCFWILVAIFVLSVVNCVPLVSFICSFFSDFIISFREKSSNMTIRFFF